MCKFIRVTPSVTWTHRYIYIYIYIIVINSVPFRPERTEIFVPAWRTVPETPPFHLGLDFGVFRPVSAIPTNFGRYVILSKKKKKGPNDAVLDLSKYLGQTLFFHSFTLTFTLKSSLPSFSSHCRRAHCRCSPLSITRLSHTQLSLTLSQSHSLGLNSQGILSLLSLSRIQASVQLQPNHFFFSYDLLCG